MTALPLEFGDLGADLGVQTRGPVLRGGEVMREAHGARTRPTRGVQVELGGVIATRTARLEEVKVLAIAEETERTRALWGVIGGFGDADDGGVEFDGGAVAGDGVCPPGGLELGGGGGRLWGR